MKRLHVHLRVDDIDQSVRFYNALFGREPDRCEADYAKWLIDEPPANIAISSRGDDGRTGVDHIGVQLDDDGALGEVAARLTAANAQIAEEADATCCYARSNKYWALSPEGARWELFHTFGDSATFGVEPSVANVAGATETQAACCGGK